MTEPIRIVAALIRDAEGRVLLVRKRGTAAFMQPGGKRDAGEDDVTALARELDEELGCRAVPETFSALGTFECVAANEPDRQINAAVYAVHVGRHHRPRRDRRDPLDRPVVAARHSPRAADARSRAAARAMMASDLLDRMRRNPAGDWNIRDVELLRREHGLLFRAGKGTSHCHAKHPSAREILTIPARRLIKPVYIRKLVRYIETCGAKT